MEHGWEWISVRRSTGEEDMNNNQGLNDEINSEADDRIYSTNTLTRIAYWAMILSWVSLILNVALFMGRLLLQFQEGFDFQMVSLFNLVAFLSSLVVGIIWFVVLQAISEGIYLLLDIEENMRTDM